MNKYVKWSFVFGVSCFLLYFIAAIFQSDLWGDILSSLGTLSSFIILLHVYKKSERMKSVWLMKSIAALIWIFSDIIWGICEILIGINPDNMTIFTLLYLLPNICIMTSGFIYMKKFIKGANAVQLLLDIFAISTSCLVMFWFLFLKENIFLFIKDVNNIMSFIYVITDFIIINWVIIWFFSVRRGKVTRGMYITLLGATIYAANDLVCTYEYFYDLYVPNSITDTIYLLSFLIIAFGGISVLKYNNCKWAYEFYSQTKNIGNTKKSLILLLTIPIYIIFKGFDFDKILILFLIFAIYEIASNYVQKAINNEKLLNDEKNINLILEEKIEERTKELLLKNEDLEYISYHDFVTNVYNGRYLKKRLDDIINEKISNQKITIYYIDVDRFKTINDTYGHDIGDSLLIEIAQRLQKEIDENGIVARLGGDEFVIAIEGDLSKDEIEKFAQKITRSCNESIYIENYEFNITISIGIATFPTDATSRNVLMKNADMAMYYAKSKGQNKYEIFNSNISNLILEKNEIELLLKNADYNNEFQLYYQPQIDINTNELVGMEALIRWNSPIKGNISPNKFIKIAEETGSIEKISDWVMNTAAKQIGIWNKKFGLNMKMGINISPNQLDSINFAHKLEKILEEYDLDSDWIDIEITENIAMKGEAILGEIFSMLSSMGISTSIDDFGTGYSSLSYIQQFSFDRLKIAKELIDNIVTDLSKRHIVKAIVMLAEALNVLTIAEGIETEEQLEVIKEIGCNQVQGYIFSKPLTADMFEENFLAAEKVEIQ